MSEGHGYPLDGVLVGASLLWPWGTDRPCKIGLIELIIVSFHIVKFVGLA